MIQVFIAQYSLVYGPNTPMWFVPCLFLVECVYYYISAINNVVKRGILVIGIVIFGWFTQSSFCRWDFSVVPWNFSGACFALGFYAIGNMILQNHYSLLNGWYKRTNQYSKVIVSLLMVMLLCFLAELNGHVSIGSRLFQNGFLFYLTGIIGTALIFMLALTINKRKLLRFWGENSFLIMATHIVFYNILSGVFQALGGESLADNKTSLIHSIVSIAIVMATCSAFSIMYNKAKKMCKKL